MTNKPTPDEQPKRTVARRVVSEKRQYFVPAHGVSVEATDCASAVTAAKRAANKQEDGDGKS